MVRMRELARLSGVPSSTIKHYLREGLLPSALIRVARNSALYDPSLVAHIQHIKAMQREHFLPLWKIREVLAGKRTQDLASVEAAVGRAAEQLGSGRRETRASLQARGVQPAELQELERLQLVDAADPLSGADLRLVEAIIAARKGGLTGNLDTLAVIREYARAVRALARAELSIFAEAIAGADNHLVPLTEKALEISEDIVRCMRQRLLLQELGAMDTLPRGRDTLSRRRRT